MCWAKWRKPRRRLPQEGNFPLCPGPTSVTESHKIYRKGAVGVGIMIAHNPLHGSGRADFPHPALALGDDAHAAQGLGMTDLGQGQPSGDEALHTLPEDTTVLATPRKRTMPEP